MLSYTLAPASLEELVRGSGYVMLHRDLASPAGVLMQLVENEVTRSTQAFATAAVDLRRLDQRWAGVQTVVVVDTSLVLHHEHELGSIDWSEIAQARLERVDVVVTTVVLDELDKTKDGPGRKPVAEGAPGDTRTRARRTLRFLADRFAEPLGAHRLSYFSFDSRTADVFLRLDVDPLDHVPLAVADAELVDRAVALRDVTGARVIVATRDVAQSLRARMQGLESYLHPVAD